MNRATKTLVIFTMVVVAYTGAYLGILLFDRACTELALAHFRARPSAAGAQALVELIDDESATPKEIERILPLLLTPKVTQQEKYPLGEAPTVEVGLPFELVFRNLRVDVNESVWVNGVRQYATGMTGAGTLRTDSHPLALYPAPTEPGTYSMEIRSTCQLRLRYQRIWQWDPRHGVILPRRQFVEVPPSLQQEPIYECRVTVPVELVVAPQPPLPVRP